MKRRDRPTLIEKTDDRCRKARELVNSHNDWYISYRAGLSEHYRKGKQKIALRCIDSSDRYWGIILEVRPNGDKPKPFRKHFGTDLDSIGQNAHTNEPYMLPHNVEVMKGNKQKVLPSAPRLQRFDNSYIGSREPLYFFTSCVFPMLESTLVPTDRKSHVFWAYVAIADGKNIDEQIQAATNAVNDDANFGIDDGGNSAITPKINALLANLRIQIIGNCVRGFLNPNFNSPFKRIELGYGPINSGLCI